MGLNNSQPSCCHWLRNTHFVRSLSYVGRRHGVLSGDRSRSTPTAMLALEGRRDVVFNQFLPSFCSVLNSLGGGGALPCTGRQRGVVNISCFLNHESQFRSLPLPLARAMSLVQTTYCPVVWFALQGKGLPLGSLWFSMKVHLIEGYGITSFLCLPVELGGFKIGLQVLWHPSLWKVESNFPPRSDPVGPSRLDY